MAVATAIAIAHQVGPSNERHNKPISELEKWPMMMLRGCENGASGKPNTSTQDAPNEPSINTAVNASASNATLDMPIKPPSHASKTDFIGGRGGRDVPSPFNLLKKNIKRPHCIIELLEFETDF